MFNTLCVHAKKANFEIQQQKSFGIFDKNMVTAIYRNHMTVILLQKNLLNYLRTTAIIRLHSDEEKKIFKKYILNFQI